MNDIAKMHLPVLLSSILEHTSIIFFIIKLYFCLNPYFCLWTHISVTPRRNSGILKQCDPILLHFSMGGKLSLSKSEM